MLSFGNWYSHFRCKARSKLWRAIINIHKHVTGNGLESMSAWHKPNYPPRGFISLIPKSWTRQFQLNVSHMLQPYITSELYTVLYYTPTSWKHMPICFYVHIPSAEVLDPFLIQISEGLTEWLNHQASCQGCTPSGWLIETTLAPFVQPPVCSVNLQAVFNEMSPLWHGPRPRRWTCHQDTSWAERSLRITVPVNWPGLKGV